MQNLLAKPARQPLNLAVFLLSVVGIASFVICAVLLCLLVLPIAAASALLDRRKRLLHSFISWACYSFLRAFPFWDFRMEGTENIPGDRPVIFVSNHQSVLDILLLSGLNTQFRWVAKDAVFRAPVLGWIARMAGYISLNRDGARGLKRSFANMDRCLADGISIMIFPEGTRSQTGALLDFKKGAFRQSILSNVAIVPIVLDGTGAALAKNSFKVTPGGAIRVEVLPLVEPSAADYDDARLSQHVRGLMAQKLQDMRNEEAYAQYEDDDGEGEFCPI